MSGLEPIMIGALVAGTATAAAGKVMAGYERSAAAEFEGQQYRIQEQQNRTAAAQAEAQRRNELTSNMEAIQAIRSGRGVGMGSPTGMAIMSNTISEAENDLMIERANYNQRADLARRAGIMSERKSKNSLIAGYLGGVEEIASGVYKGTAGKKA